MVEVLDDLYFQRLGSALSDFLPDEFSFLAPSSLPEGVLQHPNLQNAVRALSQLAHLQLFAYCFINSCNSSTRLPAEIWIQIFRQVLDVDRFDDFQWHDRRHYFKNLGSLRLVCKRWDDLIVSCPVFWSYVCSEERGYAAAIRLSRSGTLRLHVFCYAKEKDCRCLTLLENDYHRIATLHCPRLHLWSQHSSLAPSRVSSPFLDTTKIRANLFNSIKYLSVDVGITPAQGLACLSQFTVLEHLRLSEKLKHGTQLMWPSDPLPSLNVLELDDICSDAASAVFKTLDAPQCRHIRWAPGEPPYGARHQWAGHIDRSTARLGGALRLQILGTSLLCHVWAGSRTMVYEVLMTTPFRHLIFEALHKTFGSTIHDIILHPRGFQTHSDAIHGMKFFPHLDRLEVINGNQSITSSILLSLLHVDSDNTRWVFPKLAQLRVTCGQATCGNGANLEALVDVVKTRLEGRAAGEKLIAPAPIKKIRIECPKRSSRCEETLLEIRALGIDCAWV